MFQSFCDYPFKSKHMKILVFKNWYSVLFDHLFNRVEHFKLYYNAFLLSEETKFFPGSENIALILFN